MTLNWNAFKKLKEGYEGHDGEQGEAEQGDEYGGHREPEYEKDHTHTESDKNDKGGFDPENKKELEIHKNADLITLPTSIPGTNCSNCHAYRKIDEDTGFCEDERVNVHVTPRMCCKFWDRDDIDRAWGEMEA